MIAPTADETDEILDLTRPEPLGNREAEEPEPELLATEDSWWAHARCNDGSGRFATMFFSEELQDIARAKHICATCPAMIPCLEGALGAARAVGRLGRPALPQRQDTGHQEGGEAGHPSWLGRRISCPTSRS